MIDRQKINFLTNFHELGEISPLYKSLKYSFNENKIYQSKNINSFSKNKKPFVTTIVAFPKFLFPTFQKNKLVRVKKVIQRNQDCYGIKIDSKTEGIDSYLRSHFSKSSRSPITKKKKRLESCFNINYKIYYGDIKKEVYNKLMRATEEMLIKRFAQRNDSNYVLDTWSDYYKKLYPLIIMGAASIFVIYDSKKPIQISINYHYNKILFAFIPAYDIDYEKFGLGNTGVYKQLDWCIKNDYEYLDMGNGDFEYKKRWCNYHYMLETQIISSKRNILANCLSFVHLLIIHFKNLLKKINFDIVYNNLKSNKKNSSVGNSNQNPYTFKSISEFPDVKKITKISLSDLEHFPLKKPVYDFLYSYQEHIDNMILYNINDEHNCYIIKGENNFVKCILNEIIS